jgi:hypothetical protein
VTHRVSLGVIVLAAGLWAAAPASAGEPTYEIKFNTVAVPTQPESKATEVFGKNLEALSVGKITVRTFHSGQLGDHQKPDHRASLSANSYHYLTLSEGTMLAYLVRRQSSTMIHREGDWPCV